MVSNELKQLLSGESVYSRDGAPEPLLLPRIATRIPPDGLGFIASAAKISSGFWLSGGSPAIADATAEAIALRHTELSDEQLGQLCDELPRLILALIELDEAAGRRAETIIGSDHANRLRAGPGDTTSILREAVKRVFDEPDPPHTVDELMVFIRDHSEYEGPELQRNLLAYFLPMAPAMHHGWMVPILINVLGTYPDWSVAAAASRLAGLLDQAAIEQVEASLECADPWANHVRGLLAGSAAGSAFEEVARALPFDNRLEHLLASETELASLTGFAESILEDWGGSAPPKMGVSRGWEGVDSVFDLAEEVGAEPESPPERRLQAEVSAGDDVVVNEGFRKGATHAVTLWIGPDSKRSIKSDAPLQEPSPDALERQAGFMVITMTMMHGSKPQVREVELPVDRTKRSNKVEFSLAVDSDAPFVSAEVWLQHKGRILQYLKLSGLALEDPSEDIEGISLEVESFIRALPVDSSGAEFGMAVVQKDNKYIVFGPKGLERTEVSLSGSGEVVKDLSRDLFNATENLFHILDSHSGATWVDDQNEEALRLLRKMATHGNEFYDELKIQGVLERFSETIQFVNLDDSDIVPIEYVYDRGYPKKGATLCEGFRDSEDWNEIFAAGKCSCSNEPGKESTTICPMGFWSLSKIIERQSGSRGEPVSAANGLSQPSEETPAIPLARNAMLAAAPNVRKEDIKSIEDMLDSTYPDRYKYANGWNEWKAEIEESSPRLLILLPHHGAPVGGDRDFLEISSATPEDDGKLFSGTLNESCVSKNPGEPGPIVLLLGCETAQSGLLPYSTFARKFLANRASIVVGTQSTVLGRHAAQVANEFIRQLLPSAGKGESFGRVMRDVRRKMFASGYLMSLTLVCFGDADWKLDNSTSGENDVSH